MKKWLIICVALLLTACGDPKDIVINSLDDLPKNEKALKKLPDEDLQLMSAYFVRMEMANAFGQAFGGSTTSPYGITVGEAIQREKDYRENKVKKEAEEKAAAEKARQELAAKQKAINDAVNVILIDKQSVEGKYSGKNAKIILKFKNNSNKNIIGVKGLMVFRDKFGDDVFRIKIKEDFEESGGIINPGSETLITSYYDINQFISGDTIFDKTPASELSFDYQPELVLFEDGTSVKVEN
ncbi:MAG: hypothetical protein Q4G42_05090 [Neisseria sp.]|nr:hypothetical protein [Neisseria sp.]